MIGILGERVEKRGEPLLKTVLLEVARANLLLRNPLGRAFGIDVGGSPGSFLVRARLALRRRVRRDLIIKVAHIHLRQLV